AVFPELLEPGVQVADVGDDANDGLAVELDDEPQHPVRGGVLWAEVDQHVLAARPGLAESLRLGRCGGEREARRSALRVQPRRRSGKSFRSGWPSAYVAHIRMRRRSGWPRNAMPNMS